MIPDVNVSSFDRPRDRRAPSSLTGKSLAGKTLTYVFEGLTLIVAVKTSCDGCRDFVLSPLGELGDVTVHVVSATPDVTGEWTDAVQPVVVAPEFLQMLDVRWPPFYVLIDPDAQRVVVEGVVFGPTQVAAEISPYLKS